MIISELIPALSFLKANCISLVTKRPATFHGLDLLLRIAGWEEAAARGDTSFRLDRKIQQILEEELFNMRGY